MNSSTVCDGIKMEKENNGVIILVISLLSLLALTGFIGNITVIGVALSRSNRHMKTYVFVVSLAVADLIVCVLCMPLAIIQQFTDSQLVRDRVVFQFSTSSDIMFCTVSIWNLMCLTTDRYIALCYPLRYKAYMCWKNVIILLSSSWIFPGIMSYGLIFSGVHQIGADMTLVDDNWYCLLNVSFYYAVIGSGLGFYIPSIIITIFNIKVFYEIKKSSKYLKTLVNTHTLPQNKSIRETEIRVARTMVILMTCFFICWCPFFILNVFHPLITDNIADIIVPYVIVTWLGYVNSVLNPYLYLYLSSSKKDSRFLCCTKCFKNQKNIKAPQVNKKEQRCHLKVLSLRNVNDELSPEPDRTNYEDTRL